MPPIRYRFILVVHTAVALAIATGCSKSSGVSRYTLDGAVSYQGKPVPSGRISFYPDSQKGNGGPAGMADISNGRYQTRSGNGQIGGPHVVTIYGEDGTMATETRNNALFAPHELLVDFPKEDSTMDFDVPAK